MEKGLIRRLLPLILLGAGSLPAIAQTAPLPRGADKAPEAIRRWLGAWDLEMEGATRSCTVTLGAETTGNVRQLRFPATCRRALPILDTAAAWTLAANGQPLLLDAGGKEVIGFQKGSPEAGSDGKGRDGKAYRLLSKDHPRAAAPRPSNSAAAAATAAQRPTIVDPAKAPAAEALPGRYSVMRQQNREACRLVLSPPSANGSATAAFEGSCQDTGLTIFDPAGWRYAGGRLTLVARRGHGTDLVFENGQWRKDPAVGAPLLMRKLNP
ncbi:protease inhibitor Inh/omp19 family protein [Bosea sp. NBC_00550]|uniref:protease inhibitor Inh/omp19 family protein n=1 Tax=Bosea sp. NBC_00550 TaxID=2969621 RepID=UPI002230F076|nr:protease inhibitor Inh/omp19 family protein [Bosea sp. NBC_00550]UZF90501.1 protease inhibitor Inh/omp19 family protein [Bosea sp. NBC_00550]